MAILGLFIASLAAGTFFVLAAISLCAPRTDWSRWFASALVCLGAYETFDGLSVATDNAAAFELSARASCALAPAALMSWWMATGRLVRANPSSLHGYLRSTATLSLMMLAAAIAALGFVDDGLFAYAQSAPAESPWTNYSLTPSPLYILMIVLMVSVTGVSVVNVALAKYWRPTAVPAGLIVTAVGFAALGPLTSLNFYFGGGIPEPAIMSLMAVGGQN